MRLEDLPPVAKLTYSRLFIALLSLSLIAAAFGVSQALRSALPVSSLFIQGSMYILFAFLVILVLRYFLLMWFSYLDHLEELTQEAGPVFTPRVSIIVPAFNEGKVIESSIRSLLELDYPNFEIIVVDDGSSDDTFQKARRFEGLHGLHRIPVRVLSQPNGGKARALNRGISLAEGALVLCMDGDSKLTPQTLRRAVRHFVDPTIGAVAGNVKVVNRHNLLCRLQALEYIEGLNLVRKAQGFFRIVNIIPGPIGIFRRRVLEQVRYYAADTYAEDCDLTLNILMHGWRIKYEPEAIAYTEAPESIRDLIRQRYRWTRGILQSIRKHKRALVSFQHGSTNTFVLWYMIFEGLLWPAMNVASNLLFITLGAFYGYSHFAVFWWLQLTILDLGAALYCVSIEREALLLVPYSVFYRLFFVLAIDVCKLLGTVDELLGLRMSWGKLERSGRL
jgi:cellulose synthase/poly-beta-1,6-N-acetylglucosamine synthase-like glycosyltransferase